MVKYVLQRLLYMVPVILALVLVVFFIMYMTPGDPTVTILGNEYTAEASMKLKKELGIDRPFFVQFFNYVTDLLKGDFGLSYVTRRPVSEQIGVRFPNTAALVFGSLIFSVGIGIPLGIHAGTKPYSLFSNVTTVIGLLGVSMPVFWLGLLVILLFSVRLGWLPAGGLDGFSSLIMPCMVLGFNGMASIMRTTRSSLLEVTRQDYIRTAKAKGVSEQAVIQRHALKNAMMPTITIIGMTVGTLLGGVALTEVVFSIPGTGRLLVDSIRMRDTPSILGCLVVMAVTVALSNLVVDLIYAYIDPRIKAKYSRRA